MTEKNKINSVVKMMKFDISQFDLFSYQKQTVLDALIYYSDEYPFGIRPVTIANLCGLPQATVRKFLNDFYALGIAKKKIIDQSYSLFKVVFK